MPAVVAPGGSAYWLSALHCPDARQCGLPRYIIVSDFARFRWYYLEGDIEVEFRLADLHDPLTIPPELVKTHHQLDTAVDAAYGKRNFRNDAERVAFLFELYRKYTSLLPAGRTSTAKRKSAKKLPV